MSASHRRIFLTGASSGLGEGLALAYATPGRTLGLLARREDELSRVRAAVEARGARAFVYPVDVVDTRATKEALENFARAADGLDLVIANAGIGEGRRDERFDAEKVAEVFRVNLVGLTNTLLPAIPILRALGGGTLVGMASVAAYRALPGSLAYSASKSAVLTLLEGLGMELRGTGIHTVALCPGFIRTPLTDKNEFSMPFLLERDEACARMRRAIDARKRRYTFPFPMFVAAQLLRILPESLLLRFTPRARPR